MEETISRRLCFARSYQNQYPMIGKNARVLLSTEFFDDDLAKKSCITSHQDAG